MTRFLPRFALALAVSLVALFTLAARPARAEPVAPELMAKLAAYATVFEQQAKHANYEFSGRMEILDSDNIIQGSKEFVAHVDANGGNPRITVVKYIDDGKDKTAEAQKDSRENEEKRKKKKDAGKDLKMPIVEGQQERYTFDEAERSPDGTRVKIHFAPKEAGDDTFDGSAWVNVETGTVVSASFRMSKTPMFVHYLHFTVEFGEQTPLGPAVSKITVEGEGGILFIRRHFRGTATLSGYTITP